MVIWRVVNLNIILVKLIWNQKGSRYVDLFVILKQNSIVHICIRNKFNRNFSFFKNNDIIITYEKTLFLLKTFSTWYYFPSIRRQEQVMMTKREKLALKTEMFDIWENIRQCSTNDARKESNGAATWPNTSIVNHLHKTVLTFPC